EERLDRRAARHARDADFDSPRRRRHHPHLLRPRGRAGDRMRTFDLRRAASASAAVVLIAVTVSAQHASFRIKGRIVKPEDGAGIADAEVRTEAFYGY